ncbi:MULTISPECIES: hypothetical protein [unclassified Mesorhizobium]|uniref:hypothetical protein n=1 Tax=unclassified Mesorhizobium TaxID=325217 RepID=UPI000FCCBAB8|nr:MULTISPECIES: hypothetical protein [unclassified Mesorhizobium]RUV26283.1 hypothetical protein EOA91_05130 [Mesorhizobium sp. M1A.F.Ca.IN.022.04.1.1]RWG25590.1 MAG: hypothetical protein EOQ60_29310 [Mesorhizobium sp.]TIS17004.1 MAG: hypothetical protein E5X10_05370 [Mesorhizobium sp.]
MIAFSRNDLADMRNPLSRKRDDQYSGVCDMVSTSGGWSFMALPGRGSHLLEIFFLGRALVRIDARQLVPFLAEVFVFGLVAVEERMSPEIAVHAPTVSSA